MTDDDRRKKEDSYVQDSPHEEYAPSTNPDAAPQQRSGDVIKRWVESHFQILIEHQEKFEENIMGELRNLGSKIEALLSIHIRSGTQGDEQPEVANNGAKIDDGNCQGAWSYVTPPSFQYDNEYHQIKNIENEIENDEDKDDEMVEVTSPHPRPVRTKKRGRVLVSPYTNPTKKRKFRKGDGCVFNPFRPIDSHKEEAFNKWFEEKDKRYFIHTL